MRNKLIAWVKRGPYYLLTLTTLIIFIFLLFYPNEELRDLFSKVFTIIGVIFVIVQLISDYHKYKPDSQENIISWFFSLFKKGYLLEGEVGFYGTSNLECRKPSRRVIINPDDSIEDKVNKIVRNLSYLDEDIIQTNINLKDTKKELLSKIIRNESEIKKTTNNLNGKIQNHIIDSFQMAFFGIVTTFCGAFLSFLPNLSLIFN